ncbi:MAG: DUF2868 domain-containing protein [Candidatus Accumulibacter sp.]|uniref:DUF2868 domain-containing protein n=1 Tax=Accumulibacter sp. TaxID=2053492 RepID=UPI001A454394|nr:DUF2868 domain-containing protein [Accumulibacter sp.]MBL8394835.1 DUF2868 domain-containing protein [Accumulibacter sp.]
MSTGTPVLALLPAGAPPGCAAGRPLVMALDESSALAVMTLRSFETADHTHALWTDADRAWASHAAAEVVGDGATDAAFLAQRARLGLHRLGERFKSVPRAVRALRWRPWLGGASVLAAGLAGLLVDRLGGGQRINILMPPVLMLLLWNLAVYLLLALGILLPQRAIDRPRPLRRAISRLAVGLRQPPGGSELAAVVAQLSCDWLRIATPLYAARAARVLHLAAASFATGLLAGLYLRGLAFEYHASWESTFLDPASVHGLLAAALAPGAALTGIPVPSVGEIAAIRAPSGENAARWLHLLAASGAVVVIVPRLLLALFAWLIERRRSAKLAIGLDDAYFQRLLRDFRGDPAQLTVVPYSYTLPSAAAAGLQRLAVRALGGNTLLTIGPTLCYGDEETSGNAGGAPQAGHLLALFNATATPERETHGAFLAGLAGRLGPVGRLVALVDLSAFLARAPDIGRCAARRTAWRELCASQQVRCVFADLAASSGSATSDTAGRLDEAASALAQALEGGSR